MGTFRIEIQAVGGHGCQRDKTGDDVAGCGSPTCPDCIARESVQKLKAAGCSFDTTGTQNSVGYAQLTHWPGSGGAVFDNLLTNHRNGKF
jgi:hypothetical protein